MVLKKEVQTSTRNTTGRKDLYFTIYSLLKQGLNPSAICKALDMKKQRLQYYLTSLKKRNLVQKIGYGTYEIADKYVQTSTRNTSRIGQNTLREENLRLTPDKVRGHAFMFKLLVPNGLRNWDKREEIFKKKGIKFKELKHLFGGGQNLEIKGRRVHLTKNSIIIHEKASYLADTAQEAKDHAVSDLIGIVKALERRLQASFSFGGKYKFKVSRQHYSLIKNALAKQYDREGKKLEVYNTSGLWFLIDNSFNLHEAETVHPKTAVKDNEKVQDFFNGLKEQEGFTPAFVVDTMQGIQNNQLLFTQNINTHIKAIQDLGSGVRTFTNQIEENNQINKKILSIIKKLEGGK